jgi:hypothetical protein
VCAYIIISTSAVDAHVVDGVITLEVLPNWAYTITTVRTGGKGLSNPPAPVKFPRSYADSFDACPLGEESFDSP